MTHISHLARSATMLVSLCTMTACGAAARLPVSAGTGPKPELPPPDTSLIGTHGALLRMTIALRPLGY